MIFFAQGDLEYRKNKERKKNIKAEHKDIHPGVILSVDFFLPFFKLSLVAPIYSWHHFQPSNHFQTTYHGTISGRAYYLCSSWWRHLMKNRFLKTLSMNKGSKDGLVNHMHFGNSNLHVLFGTSPLYVNDNNLRRGYLSPYFRGASCQTRYGKFSSSKWIRDDN